jgi:hypothetical protein
LFYLKEKEQIFLFDFQRISILDPRNGKTKRKVNKVSNLLKNVVSMNQSDSSEYYSNDYKNIFDFLFHFINRTIFNWHSKQW